MTKISPIIGHEKVQAQLVRLMGQGILPHAILLTGPKGIGKAALADTLARCLLTGASDVDGGAQEESLFGDALPEVLPTTLSYDADHPAIARIEAGGHGNIKRVEPLKDEKKKMSFTTINVDQVREDIVDFLHHTTAEKGWRIVMVDPADGLNPNAENALLKILEEPPKQTLLVLITHQPDKLLPTTRSRCREFKLLPPTVEQVVEILAKQRITLSAEQQQWLTQLAPVSVGQWARYVEREADVIYADWLELLAAQTIPKLQSFVTKAAKQDAEGWQLVGDLLLCALHRLSISAHSPLELLAVEQQHFPTLLARAEPQHWQHLWQQAVEWLPRTTRSNYDKKQIDVENNFSKR